MRLSTKGRYGVTAMMDLAIHDNAGPVTLADISQCQGISLSYLEQLFAKLRKAGLVEGVRGLMLGEVPDTSVVGIAVLVASLLVMPPLAAMKRRVGLALGGDPLILADAAETRICILLSASTLAGLVLFQLTGAAWLDPVAGFVIGAFAVREGIEAWHGELVETDDDD